MLEHGGPSLAAPEARASGAARQCEQHPLVSCIMPTANRREFVALSLEYFLAQDYPNKELIVLDDGEDQVGDLFEGQQNVRYVWQPPGQSLGAKRNRLCELASGSVIAHWDDDDWQAPHRLSYQIGELVRTDMQMCGITDPLFYAPASRGAWRYQYPGGQRFWLAGSTLVYRRDYWEAHAFPSIDVGEDARFVWSGNQAEMHVLGDASFHVGIVHDTNASPKQTQGSRWQPIEADNIVQMMGADARHYEHRSDHVAEVGPARARKKALVAVAYGIGDALRATPLVRALKSLGYDVDFLVAPDFPETTSLFDGCDDIERVLHYDDFRSNGGRAPVPGIDGVMYDVAVLSHWAGVLRPRIKAQKILEISKQDWLAHGDSACFAIMAQKLGWSSDMPEAFAGASDRQFDIPPGTIALHPGCKRDWPWKKWHGFDELARKLPNVVVVGTASDLDNSDTYFKKPFDWPEHAQDYVGKLSIADTAALLSQCAALVSNDSGMMQLAVSLGVPTFGIFGITSPAREAIPQSNMHPITKGLSCEEACHRGSWGRRTCAHSLKCLRTLTADEVLKKIEPVIAPLTGGDSAEKPSIPTNEVDRSMKNQPLSLTYYGYVFDASGYGRAARDYIHALHAAGVKMSVVDLADRSKQINDPLVESLIGTPQDSDFHLFHGIPSQWSRLAFSRRNCIGMTVWETDTVPSQWQNPLNHTLDVWVPSNFNVDTFSNSLESTVFRLPHPMDTSFLNGAPKNGIDINARLGFGKDDFVFYSIFEWQDRKNPNGLLEAYFEAFPTDEGQVLVIKANPGAAPTAKRVLDEYRRRYGSDARVVIRCEALSDEEIQMLHRRGDCYVSLHYGEGWAYPLFDAASLGTPVIATRYSGPLDYLDTDYPGLVDCDPARVVQPYVYYNRLMRWATPRLDAAADRMRWVFENYDEARSHAKRHRRRIITEYSAERVGAAAKSRLLDLLCQTQRSRGIYLKRLELADVERPDAPIPGAWYDSDYFEHGLKSNWREGYSWQLYGNLFRDTAKMLTEMFAPAESFLDAGCAKGFLVRCLCESGKDCVGVDHSNWAIGQSDAETRPHLHEASVDKYAPDRRFDVLLALNLFESLSEKQILKFLRRARKWTDQAMFAVISTVENEEERARLDSDMDLSHVSLKSRAEWDELFRKAGWRQDALHQMAERTVQEHPLCKKMSWRVFVYSPV